MTFVLFILIALVLIALFCIYELRTKVQYLEADNDSFNVHLKATQKKLAAEQEKTVRNLQRLGAIQAKLDDTQSKLTATEAQLADAKLRIAAASENLDNTAAPTADDPETTF